MPKAILEFNLPEEREDFEIHNNAGSYYSAIFEIRVYIRNLNKYDDRDIIPKEELTEKLLDLMQDLPD